MKKLLVATLLTLSMVSFAAAEGSAAGSKAAGLGIDLAVPFGDLSNAAGVGYGLTGQFDYGFNQKITLIGSIGYMMFAEKNNWEGSSIPIKVGATYCLANVMPGLYAIGEVGFDMLSFDWSGPFGGSSSHNELCLVPGIGWQKPMGSMTLDVSARMSFVDGGSRIGIRAGVKKAL
ncbi:MAG: hypothetical protein BWY06_01379 [Candidatus Latescibacteria bacterium ADurb.Bin168]|nr:MAG: hypothetical protein BWY06_01379 [Candidatus Latescibacteria bacterium ADurb.Bin168]